MAFKVLGQVNPTLNTDTTLYTVPAAKQAVVQNMSICNQSATPGLVRVAVRPAGATLSAVMYLLFDYSWDGLMGDFLVIGITLAATDVVTVRANTSNFSFGLYGDES